MSVRYSKCQTLIITQVEVRSQNRVNSHSSFSSSGVERVTFLLLSAVVEVWIRHVRIWRGSGQIAKILDPVHPNTATNIISAKWMEWKLVDIMFSLVCGDVCNCVCPCGCVQMDDSWKKTNTFKAMDFKFDLHVPRDSPDRTHLKFFKKGPWTG